MGISGVGEAILNEFDLHESISVDDLPDGTKSELPYVLKDEAPSLSEVDGDEIAANLFGLAEPPMVKVGYADPSVLKKQFDKNRRTNLATVKKYAEMVKSGVEFDPVFISDGQFIDGGHRVEAYVMAGKDKIPVVDIGELVNMDWKSWMDGDSVAEDFDYEFTNWIGKSKDLDEDDMPAVEPGEFERFYYIAPMDKKSAIEKKGLHSVHEKEHLYTDESEAVAYAKYLNKHLKKPVSIFMVDGDVELHNKKNVAKKGHDPVWMVTTKDNVPHNKITHLYDIGVKKVKGEMGESIADEFAAPLSESECQRMGMILEAVEPNDAIVHYPVTINGESQNSEGVPYHITLRWGKWDAPKEELIAKVKEAIEGLSTARPKLTTWRPEIFRGKDGDKEFHVLAFPPTPELMALRKALEPVFGPDPFPDYKPHISVDLDLWEAIKKEKLLPGDVGVEVQPLEVAMGNASLQTLGEGLADYFIKNDDCVVLDSLDEWAAHIDELMDSADLDERSEEGVIVYRLENEKRQGPYRSDAQNVSGQWLGSPDLVRDKGFTAQDRKEFDSRKHLFGFISKEQAKAYFENPSNPHSKGDWQRLINAGFSLKKYKAKKVWYGKHQVFFEPAKPKRYTGVFREPPPPETPEDAAYRKELELTQKESTDLDESGSLKGIPTDSELYEFYTMADSEENKKQWIEDAKEEFENLDDETIDETIESWFRDGNWNYEEFQEELAALPEAKKREKRLEHFIDSYLRDREEAEDSSLVYFEKPKVLGRTVLYRFTPAKSEEILKDGFRGYAPNRLGLTHHESPGMGDLSFAFQKKDLKSKKDIHDMSLKYGPNLFQFTVPYAVKAFHNTDYEDQVVFDVETVQNLKFVGTQGENDEAIEEWMSEALAEHGGGMGIPLASIMLPDRKKNYDVLKGLKSESTGSFSRMFDKYYKSKKFFDHWLEDSESQRGKPELAQWFGLEDGFTEEEYQTAAEEWFRERFSSWEQEVSDFFSGSEIWLFRCIAVLDMDEFLGALDKGKPAKGYKGLGVYWSWDDSAAECHWGASSGKITLVTAVANVKDIDTETTAHMNLDVSSGESEKEIRLKPGAKVKVISITDSKTGELIRDYESGPKLLKADVEEDLSDWEKHIGELI